MRFVGSAVCVFLSGDKYLGNSATDCREILHDGTYKYVLRVPFCDSEGPKDWASEKRISRKR